MSWAFAIFASFSVLVISVIAFLLIVYLKEYSREERLLKQFAKSRKLENELGSMPVYIMPMPKKTTVAAVAEDKKMTKPLPVKNKKDVN